MNRINALFLIFISSALLFLLIFKYISLNVEKEPQRIKVPLKIEVYRADRHPLPDADIYLNQRFIGRTNEHGFFSREVDLIVGQKYTIHIEKDRDGYVYGPWETHFIPSVEKERSKKRKKEEGLENVNILEGESDILTELERAKLGRASLYEKYHFLAILSGYMFYNIKVLSHKGKEIKGAKVIINGKYEGATDERGEFQVKYEGEDRRVDKIEISKEGEHLWMDEIEIAPNKSIVIELNKMLIIDAHILTENYGVISGVEGAVIRINNRIMGKTDKDGFARFRYRNDRGVDGNLTLKLYFPRGYIPSKSTKNYYIKKDLPKLIVHDFSYWKRPPPPKVAVIPFSVQGRGNSYLIRNALFLTRNIEDYLKAGKYYRVVDSRKIQELFKQFNIDINYSKNIEKLKWMDIPILKKEVDALIIGNIQKAGNYLSVGVAAVGYDGVKIMELNSRVSIRELRKIPERVVSLFTRRFQVEGLITYVSKNVYINLGSKNGVKAGDIFDGYINYFDNLTKKYAKKRVVKLKVMDTSTFLSGCEVESISEGYLLEPGVKVKRTREVVSKKEIVNITIRVLSSEKNKPVAGANVYVNDRWQGQTDISGKISFSATSYTDIDVLIYKESYIPNRVEIKVEDKGKSVKIKLQKGKTRFYVESEPEGALVFVDGIFVGVTPIVKKPVVLDYGFHLVEVELEGYRGYRKYIKFSSPKIKLTGNNRIKLFKDLYGEAENLYNRGMVRKALEVLKKITPDHPDYLKAISFIGYIYLNDLKDYSSAIVYYNRFLRESQKRSGAVVPVYAYYNLGQAYFNRAEQEYYIDSESSIKNYNKAIYSFSVVREKRELLPADKRYKVFINVLFYTAVSYQKIYYLSNDRNYLIRAYNSWIDYFDFFDKNLKKQEFYAEQYKVAQSYFNEIERIRSEEK